MSKPFDPTKPVQTRSGQPARILCCDAKTYDKRCIIALVKEASDNETVMIYHSDGKYHLNEEKNVDLVNIPDSRWVNIYRYLNQSEPHFGPVYKTKEKAFKGCRTSPEDKYPVPQYVTTIEIPWD